jgi:hypothetical protein
MSSIDSAFIRHLVATTQGIALEDAAAARSAGIIGHALPTLDALAGDGLFDTEPASFDRALAAQAANGNG